jgi:N,N'-diacetylchitobiose transport system substrate-binding protein
VRSRTLAGAACGLAVALSVTACGSGGGSGSGSSGSTGSKGRTLTVWLMDGDLSSQAVQQINTAFEKATGAHVKVQIQEWANINTKVSTALAQDTPPDVIEIGNTDVPLFAANGALSDLTSYRGALSAGQTWLPGLVAPATVDGKLYAAPLFAGNRAVIYNKAIWAKAGVHAAPTTYAQLTADLDKVKAHNPQAGFSAFNLPGRYWHADIQFVWDAGGDLAVQKGGTWKGALDSPAAQRGLAAFKKFQNTYSSKASRNTDNLTPDQAAMFAAGKTSAVVDTSVNTILKDKPALKKDIGTFPFPSVRTPGQNQPVFLGGSDLAIAAKSPHQSLARAYLKAAASPAVQKSAIVGTDHWTPVSTELLNETRSSLPATSAAFSKAAGTSVGTPATPGWATIESDSSLAGFFADIATGRKTPAQAARDFDAHLDQALNAHK